MIRPVGGRAVAQRRRDQAADVAAPVPRLGERPVDARRGDLEHVRRAEQRRVARRGVQGLGDDAADVGDVVEGDAAVAVDDDAHDAALAGRGDGEVLEVVAGGGDDRARAVARTRGVAVTGSTCLSAVVGRSGDRVQPSRAPQWFAGCAGRAPRRPAPPAGALLVGCAALLLADRLRRRRARARGPRRSTRTRPARAAAARERSLLAEYDAVLAAVPGSPRGSVPCARHHAEHLAALLGRPHRRARSLCDRGRRAAVPPPADDAAALARLVARSARPATRTPPTACARRALAPVLASLSASELSHPVALA